MMEDSMNPKPFLLLLAGCFCCCSSALGAQKLSITDFTFDGPLGSEGATIEERGENHFRVDLGHAPQHENWNNKLQFTILQNAKGNALRLDVHFEKGEPGLYTMNEYFASYSYDRETWHPVHWQSGDRTKDYAHDVLQFPVFAEDTVYAGHQVPMSFEKLKALIQGWRKHPAVNVRIPGESLGGRPIYRLEITDPDSPHPPEKRWPHYFANQHPGEHNSQWRMAGMIGWLLSDAGKDCRQRTICHFVPMMSPDAPSHGWYRVNAQGVDMNRSYRPEGADESGQAHEAYIAQRDLEMLMASAAPPVTIWSMHTWGGKVDPRIIPGPELGGVLGSWEAMNARLQENDPDDLVKAMEKHPCKKSAGTHWTQGPHLQFGVTAVLCEGAGNIYTKAENIESGAVLMKTIAAHYNGLRRNE
jgi:hypothetical protein